MRFGCTLMAATLLTGGIVIGQARPDLYALERKIQDARTAMDRALPSDIHRGDSGRA